MAFQASMCKNPSGPVKGKHNPTAWVERCIVISWAGSTGFWVMANQRSSVQTMDGLNYSTRMVEQPKQPAKNIRCQSSSTNHGCHRSETTEPHRDTGNPGGYSFKRFKATTAIRVKVVVELTRLIGKRWEGLDPKSDNPCGGRATWSTWSETSTCGD